MSTPQEFFAGSAAGLALFEAVAETIATIGSAAMKVSKSQIAFRRRTAFAFVWRPDRYVTTDVPAVLSFGAPQELHSPRFKQVVHVAPHVWMHHIDLRDAQQVDAEVRDWLTVAFDNAG